MSLKADFQRCKRDFGLRDPRVDDACRDRLGRSGSTHAGTCGSGFSTSRLGGDPVVDVVPVEPISLSGGVGGGLVNVGGHGVDLDPGGIYIGVSYGRAVGGYLRVFLTVRGLMQSSEEVSRRWLELLPYLT